jgi:sRNA-binding carbon storage regulator CsrA
MLVRRLLTGTVVTIGGGEIQVKVIQGKGVVLGITAPSDMAIDAKEVARNRPPICRQLRQTRKQEKKPIDNPVDLGQG